jgi:hypothetical protein
VSEIRRNADHFIKYIVEPCTKELELGEPIRADSLPEPGRITSQVVKLLRSADLVIADLTGDNVNVYYELSFRHTIGRPTVHMALEGTDLPFDLAGERVIHCTMHIADVDGRRRTWQPKSRRFLSRDTSRATLFWTL